MKVDPMLLPKLRPACESDLAAIAEIYNHEVLNGTATFDTEPRSTDDVRAWLLGRGPRYPALVAVVSEGLSEGQGERIIGFSALYPWSPRKAYAATAENTVYVREENRGSGAGALLLRAVLDEGRRAGIHTVIARISSVNEASIRFHRKLGFEKIGTMKEVGHKFGRLLDVDVMQLIFPE